MSDSASTAKHLSAHFARAVDYARAVHAPDIRKGTSIPYIAHLLSVSALVLEHGGDEDQAIAGLLHDTAEDHGGRERLADVRANFGDDVAEIVAACSDSLAGENRDKEDWRVRKVRYITHIAAMSERAVLVSAADKLHNGRAILSDYRRIDEKLWERFNKDAGRAGVVWYYRRLAQELDPRLVDLGPEAAALGEELRVTVGTFVAVVTEQVGAAQVENDWQTAMEEENALRDLSP